MSDPNAPYPPHDPTQGYPPPAYPPPPPASPLPPRFEHPQAPPVPPAGSDPTWGGQPPYTYGQPEPEPYASWGRRVAATLLDTLILLPGYVVIVIGNVLVSDSIVKNPDGTASVTDGANLGLGLALAGIAGLATLIFSIWNQIFRQGRRGATLGKQMMGILVISEENARPIGAALTFVRSIVHFLDAISCYIGYLWPLWDPKKQTFADKIMKTAVLHLPDVRF
ncbi:RDD family protein [Nocardioides marmorisolisilvae]|uniref:RDD family protein n=1 Tax=Nocardioides marmorisolisilvae TaxID=1542737 RepID=A0A3N0E0H5_9ACTN|nr:RDD family protein [Nocardioides marmorisolisilvae]RNL81359.1 RDD family protein [Nocardioides marmorisolisilvae]